jgi:exosortase/archaeosortase family protein
MPVIVYPFLEYGRYTGFTEYHGKKVITDPLPFFLVDLGAALIFVFLAFFFLAREKIVDIKPWKYEKKDGFIFGTLTLLGLSLYLYLRFFTSHNVDFTFQHRIFFIIAILGSLLFSFLSLICAVFGFKFIKRSLKDFKRELLISTIMIALYYVITINIRKSWFFLGDFVAKIVAWLLSLSFDNVVLKNSGYNYVLGAQGFVAKIGALCSGIDSMALFLGLFIIILALDWKKINKKKMAILFLPGLIGTIFVNILRIYLLYVTGINISPKFAVGMFHSNAGWVLFILYFIVFWYFAYPWVIRKHENK